ARSAEEFNAQLDELMTERSPDDVVANIDLILQRHLQREPELASRTIRLEQPSDGPLRIRVDDRVYLHPADIEDGTVRRVLRQALTEWDRRRGARCSVCSAAPRGSRNVTRLPLFSSLSTSISPWCASTIRLTMARPMPAPPKRRLAEPSIW